MRHSSEPTREMALCLTFEAEQALRRRMANLTVDESNVIRRALETPDRMLEDRTHASMRFWSWDLCADGEHPVFTWLLHFVQTLPEEGYWLLRIVADSNSLEEAGRKDRFTELDLSVIMAPRSDSGRGGPIFRQPEHHAGKSHVTHCLQA